MKIFVLLPTILLINFSVSSQCPDSIYLTTQGHVSNFSILYPNCTEIQEYLSISGPGITNLNGLNVLTSIPGRLDIVNNNSLPNLTGMENVTYIGRLEIGNNNSLPNLTGLDNVTYIGGLDITYNAALTSLSGLENVTSIGWFHISTNDALTNLGGLENLTSIVSSLTIQSNSALTSLTGLENVTSIGSLHIQYNSALTSLSGLDNATLSSSLYINYNALLSTCNLQNICDYLVSPNGSIAINNNAMGCNSPPEIANECGITLPCLPYGNYHFSSQNEIDNFTINYPNCTELMGSVMIGLYANDTGISDIVDLNGLSVVTSIEDNLTIQRNDALNSLAGLENLTSLEWNLHISSNNVLTSLAGLENLSSTGWEFNLIINGNDALTSLTGLDNIDASKIRNLGIYHNSYLSQCETESICAYLANNGWSSIFDNAIGCNSPEEVLDSCEANAVNIDEDNIRDNLLLYPNPSSGVVHLKYSISDIGYSIFEVYSLQGVKVRTLLNEVQQPGEYELSFDISDLPAGIYIVEATAGGKKVREKLVVE